MDTYDRHCAHNIAVLDALHGILALNWQAQRPTMSVNHIYQPPLTHRIDGPGLILVLSNEYPNERTNSGALHLDPPPAQKWAEEGFCVMSILITGDIHQNQSEGEGVNLDWAKIISNCIAELEQKTELEAGKKYGLIGTFTVCSLPLYFGWFKCLLVYEANFVEGILPHAVATPKLCCIVTYANLELASVLPRPLMQHIYSLGPRDSIAPQLSVQDTDNWSDIDSPGNITSPITTYRYILPDQTASSSGTAASLSTTPLQSFIHPSSPNYNHTYSTLAHTRTLTFLREQIGGPIFDIEAIWEAHTRFEFERRDVEGTMGTMVVSALAWGLYLSDRLSSARQAEPYVNHIPTLTGGIGRTALTSFYTHHFIHSNPDSTRLELVSRTVGPDRVVDELVFEFVHDREIDWM
jgi:carboxymethylenebutenolidase